MPSDQANALAFDQGGTLYVGTQCDGIAIASPADGYKSWRIVPGPITLPNAPSGTGLPSALINCLLVTKSGTVYAGTTCGLASSQDKGRTWHYRRGLDWKAKEEGRYPPVTPASVTVSGNLLSEDYVTALAERADGSLFVGHRQTSVEAFSPKTWLRVQSGLNGATTDSDISSLLVTGQTAWAGLYGGGLLPPGAAPAETTSASSPPAAPLPVPPLPVPAKPPTLAELKTMLSRANALSGEMPIGSGVYLGEDWQTQGDWVGRYGRQYAMLWAVNAPDNDEFATANVMSELYQVTGQSGPHHDAGDGIKHWVQWLRTENPHTLYNPELGYRRQAEVDDHSEAYPMTQDGPDLWFTVKVPSGVQRISFYIFNKDGYFGGNRYRDYLIKLRPFTAKKVEDMEERRGLSPPSRTRPLPDLEAATIKAPIAQARISNFRGGVYKQFLVWGPCLYLVQVSKSYSFNTICSGTFMDALTGAQLASNSAPMDMMGGIHYAPPEYDFLPKDQSLSIAASLWDALNDAYNENAATIQRRFRVESYRLALNKKADNSLLTNWRWGLTLWEDNDKIEYQKTIQKAQSSLNILNQELAAHTRISQ